MVAPFSLRRDDVGQNRDEHHHHRHQEPVIVEVATGLLGIGFSLSKAGLLSCSGPDDSSDLLLCKGQVAPPAFHGRRTHPVGVRRENFA